MIGKIKKTAKQMLGDKSVGLFLGYGRNSLGDTVPVFIKQEKDVEKLVWDESHTYSLGIQ